MKEVWANQRNRERYSPCAYGQASLQLFCRAYVKSRSTIKGVIPLLAIYNITHPKDPFDIKIPTTTNSKALERLEKIAIFEFVDRCVEKLGVKKDDMFIVSELLGTDCLGFLKVCSPYCLAPPNYAYIESNLP